MPYIKSDDYERGGLDPAVPGELNYALTTRAIAYLKGDCSLEQFNDVAHTLCNQYIDRVGMMSYTDLNAVIGVLRCCSYELRRRTRATEELRARTSDLQDDLEDLEEELYLMRVIPYENLKIEENGDVFPEELVNG